jgi:hypothetical protein
MAKNINQVVDEEGVAEVCTSHEAGEGAEVGAAASNLRQSSKPKALSLWALALEKGDRECEACEIIGSSKVDSLSLIIELHTVCEIF